VIESAYIRKGNITLEGVKDSSKGTRLPPRGRSGDPSETELTKEPLLEHKRSNRDSGATVEDVPKGYLDPCS